MFQYRFIILIAVSLLVLQGVGLFLFGQPMICECGYIKVWEGAVFSAGMSQHLSDWYTFSHIIHGFLFYLLLWYVFPRMSFGTRLLLAMGLEIGWEIAENTPWVIEAYRAQALAQGYVGDSIINSLLDTLFMMVGFFLAWRLPIWVTIVLGVLFEVGVAYAIHDNLTLNILNFIYPFDFIYRWQAGG